MKTSTKLWLQKAGFTRTVFLRWRNLVVGLFALLGVLSLSLFLSSASLRGHLEEIAASTLLYIQNGASYQTFIKEHSSIDLDHIQEVVYNEKISVPQRREDSLDQTFHSPLTWEKGLEITAISGDVAFHYLSYRPEYDRLFNTLPYTYHTVLKIAAAEGEKHPKCLLLIKGKSGFSKWMSPKNNPHACEVIWIDGEWSRDQGFFLLTSFSSGGSKVSFREVDFTH